MGLLVVIEGIRGAGKTTQAAMLAPKLTGQVISFPHPTTPWVDRIAIQPDPLAREAMKQLERLSWAYRLQNALLGDNVITEGYWPASVAETADVPVPITYWIDVSSFLPQPNLCILLEVTPERAVERINTQDEMVVEDPKVAAELVVSAARYRELWELMGRLEPGRWVTLDGNGSIEEVSVSIAAAIATFREHRWHGHHIGAGHGKEG